MIRQCVLLFLLTPTVFAANNGKVALYAEEQIYNPLAASLQSSFDLTPIPAQGALQHGVIVDSFNFAALGPSLAAIKAAYDAGQPIVILSPTPDAQAFVDDVTKGEVDLPEHLSATAKAIGDPVLEAFAVRKRPGAAAAEIAEFWVAFDGRDGTAAEEKAEDEALVRSIADWAGEAPTAAPAPAPASVASPAPRAMARASAMGSATTDQPSIEKLTEGVTRRVNFQFDKGSMATVIKSWAAYAHDQKEDWYIFELTTTSSPKNFRTKSAHIVPKFFGAAELVENDNDTDCKGQLGSLCTRERYASLVEVRMVPKTKGLELMYFGPSSDRNQDEYNYSSTFSLGGKVTAGYGEKGVSVGGEGSIGVQFGRSTKVVVKDATIIGISDTTTETAGWRAEMPAMRAVKDLAQYGGPVSDCENLLQMPYPVQQGSMETKQFAIYKLPEQERAGLSSIDMKVSLRIQEKTSTLGNPTSCNVFNCNCTPATAVAKDFKQDDTLISFPLAAHVSK